MLVSQALAMLQAASTLKATMNRSNHPFEFADTVPDMRLLAAWATEQDLDWLGVESMHPLTWAPTKDVQLEAQAAKASVTAPF
jgi:hypothetical protein